MKTTQKLLFLFVLALSVSAFTIKPNDGYKVGDIATDFRLENIDMKFIFNLFSLPKTKYHVLQAKIN